MFPTIRQPPLHATHRHKREEPSKASIAGCRCFHDGPPVETKPPPPLQPPFISKVSHGFPFVPPPGRPSGKSQHTLKAMAATMPARVAAYSAPSSPLSALSATPSISSSSPAPSILSRSPSLPPQLDSATVTTANPTAATIAMDPSCRYPSPSSTATPSGSASPLKPQNGSDAGEIQVRGSGQPPAKRRKIAERKPRTTEFLDLDARDEAAGIQLDRLLHVLRRKKKIVVVAGAGISVSAGSELNLSST